MLADKSSCIGCSACMAVCSVGAITMERDQNEFLYPNVSQDKCISCERCTMVCPILNPSVPKQTHNIAVYSGHYEQAEKTLQSASGGFVSALSETIISYGGIVYGVCYNENFSRAIYCRASSKESLDSMKGSKYIFSELSEDTYKSIKMDLKTGNPVLFVGCPCEVYAIKNYFGTNYTNLLTCELICQGGSAPKALRIFVQEKESNYKSKTKYLNMRAKRNGNANPYMMMMMMSGDVYFEPLGNTDFDVAFRNIKRESCYNCRFKMPNDVADFTAGDHIGMSEGDECYFKSGVSIIFVHNEKALKWIEKIKDFELIEESFERGAGIQTCLFNSIEKSIFYNHLVSMLQENRISGAAETINTLKTEILQKPICELSKKVRKKNLKFVIWGVGKYFESTYQAIERYFTDSQVIAIVDRYKTGVRHGIKIIKPSQLFQLEFDHIFITSVAGQKEAIEALKLNMKGNIQDYYSLVMLPSDIK